MFNPRSIPQLISYVQSFPEKIDKNKPPPRGRSHPFRGGIVGSGREGEAAGCGGCALRTRTCHGCRLPGRVSRGLEQRAADLGVVAGRDDAELRGRRVVGREHVEVLFPAVGGLVDALRRCQNARASLDHVVGLGDDEGCRAFLDGLLVQRGFGLGVDVGAGGIAGEGRRCQAGE